MILEIGVTLTRNVLNAINAARKAFEIESFPGGFFERLMMGNYIDKYKLLLFKEDIDKLSGFIGYGVDGFAVICVNYKRPVGHQNFTLAHEVGHWFLHKGKPTQILTHTKGINMQGRKRRK